MGPMSWRFMLRSKRGREEALPDSGLGPLLAWPDPHRGIDVQKMGRVPLAFQGVEHY